MDELDKKIEEAAKIFSNNMAYEGVACYGFIQGAMSPEAKEYWQEGMYTESQVRNMFIRYMFSWNNCSSDEDVDAIMNSWKIDIEKEKK